VEAATAFVGRSKQRPGGRAGAGEGRGGGLIEGRASTSSGVFVGGSVRLRWPSIRGVSGRCGVT
jgi:hypothetical protein